MAKIRFISKFRQAFVTLSDNDSECEVLDICYPESKTATGYSSIEFWDSPDKEKYVELVIGRIQE